MPSRCCEFVDSRLRRFPPDRASAVPHGQAGENAMRFPHLAHRSAAAHKLHSTPQQHGMILFRGMFKPAAADPPLAYSSPEPVQTTGTVAAHDVMASQHGLDSLASDVAAVKACLARVSSPAILVGHSYGGTLITHAGTD